MRKKIEILVDGTFSHAKSLGNIQRALNHGYEVRVYFISPEPITAWVKTQEREVVEKRPINASSFVDSYYSMLHNLQRVEEQFNGKVSISIVLKDSQNQLRDIVENTSSIKQYL